MAPGGSWKAIIGIAMAVLFVGGVVGLCVISAEQAEPNRFSAPGPSKQGYILPKYNDPPAAGVQYGYWNEDVYYREMTRFTIEKAEAQLKNARLILVLEAQVRELQAENTKLKTEAEPLPTAAMDMVSSPPADATWNAEAGRQACESYCRGFTCEPYCGSKYLKYVQSIYVGQPGASKCVCKYSAPFIRPGVSSLVFNLSVSSLQRVTTTAPTSWVTALLLKQPSIPPLQYEPDSCTGLEDEAKLSSCTVCLYSANYTSPFLYFDPESFTCIGGSKEIDVLLETPQQPSKLETQRLYAGNRSPYPPPDVSSPYQENTSRQVCLGICNTGMAQLPKLAFDRYVNDRWQGMCYCSKQADLSIKYKFWVEFNAPKPFLGSPNGIMLDDQADCTTFDDDNAWNCRMCHFWAGTQPSDTKVGGTATFFDVDTKACCASAGTNEVVVFGHFTCVKAQGYSSVLKDA